MEIETLEISGFMPALKGMRNPMNSWSKNDSYEGDEAIDYVGGELYIGKNDLELAQRLIKAGTEHSKFMRMIQVWADVSMPRYYWSEADTYSFGTKNSASTMHRLLHKTTEISKDLFVYSDKDEDIMDAIIDRLNSIRLDYLHSISPKKKHKLIRRAKQLLPEGFLQLRTWNTNYAELRNMYFQRRSHKLKPEWQDTFVEWIKTLPYAEELIMLEK